MMNHNEKGSDNLSIDFSARDVVPGVDRLFIERWSPRAFEQKKIDQTTLTRLFDAARWSPSCFNEQPWCFYTSTEQTFSDFLALLQEGNQVWAKNASVIGFLVGNTQFTRNNKPNSSYQLDCGAAWMAMTLQARMEGLYTHGMAGIHYEAVAQYLQLGDNQQVLMGFVIGYLGDKTMLNDSMQAKEKPSSRKALAEIWQPK
ncbi:nitroreductase family protein [Zooshikella harenae]|uniref:Nitroreductase family protein n=1 Tax=Zooshikella harenae TaxID=2827238 RepID=A0ABS5ZE24_9GAMM|nr:nitroreductase family protein [Zooshikella harenae]MBU2712312.1 nitroreductase family protein [Zooshikella harenae]